MGTENWKKEEHNKVGSVLLVPKKVVLCWLADCSGLPLKNKHQNRGSFERDDDARRIRTGEVG